MNIFNTLRSEYRAAADKAAFQMNVCVQSQADEKTLEKMDAAINKYVMYVNCLGILEQLEKSYQKSTLDNNEDES